MASPGYQGHSHERHAFAGTAALDNRSQTMPVVRVYERQEP